MARRRRPRDTRMGVGGMAGGLEYGERGIVESTAVTPSGPTPQASAPTGPVAPRPAVSPNAAAADPFAPTSMPRQPITAGMQSGMQPADDPVNVLRALYRRFPYPEIRKLIERRDMMGEGPPSRTAASDRWPPAPNGNMNTFGGFTGMAQSAQGDSWMRSDAVGSRVMNNTLNEIRNRGGDSRFEGTDPDRSVMSPEEQARADRQMEDIRNDPNRRSGRFNEG